MSPSRRNITLVAKGNGGTDFLRFSSDGFGSDWPPLWADGRKAAAPRDLLALMCAVLAGSPKLPGALCRGRGHLFAGDNLADTETAIAMCHTCPALTACRQWAESQPSTALSGVYGGRVHVHPSDGRRKAVLV